MLKKLVFRSLDITQHLIRFSAQHIAWEIAQSTERNETTSRIVLTLWHINALIKALRDTWQDKEDHPETKGTFDDFYQ